MKQSLSIDKNELTQGNLFHAIVRFSIPYLIASFLQNFYGLVDLLVIGHYNGVGSVTAVSVGSQVMSMITIMLVGIAMGTTVTISRSIGAQNKRSAAQYIGNSVTFFLLISVALVFILIACIGGITAILEVPPEAMSETRRYLFFCFCGVPFITAYNIIASIFRGFGDTTRPMIFVAIAGVLNIALDLILIGPFSMGAAGAAIATVIAQAVSVFIALPFLIRKCTVVNLQKSDFRFHGPYLRQILGIGLPISMQDGLIQISFLIITMIANSRGVTIAAAVGIVEKIITFLFLVPSAMLSTVSAVGAQNEGAGRHERTRKALRYAMRICLIYGTAVFILCQIIPGPFVGLFVTDSPGVVHYGAQYLRSYSIDCIFASIHFCFSGFFSACGKSIYSFLHNIISVAAVRIPGAYLASVFFPETLFPMGMAAPAGSLLSIVICIFLFRHYEKKIRPQQTAAVPDNG